MHIHVPDYPRDELSNIIFPPVMYDWRFKSAFTKRYQLRKRLRRTKSQWRAIGWDYQPVMPFDMWADIGCPEPSPRVFDVPTWARIN